MNSVSSNSCSSSWLVKRYAIGKVRLWIGREDPRSDIGKKDEENKLTYEKFNYLITTKDGLYIHNTTAWCNKYIGI